MTLMTRTFDEDLARRSQTGSQPEQTLAAPEVLTRLDRGQRYVVCAFFTPGYRPHAARLKASLDKLGLNYHLREYPERLTWESTTRIKPEFVGECMDRFSKFDILYVDADAVIREVPELFDDVSSDVALFFAPVQFRNKRALTVAAGTLYIRTTSGGRKFVKSWSEQINQASATTRDEDMIYMAFPLLAGVSFTALPQSYSKTFDSPGPKPVIEHFQASRNAFKLRRWLRRLGRLGIAAGLVVTLSVVWILSQVA